MDDLDAATGNAIRKLRLELGLSQEALAERAGLHRTYVSQLERGLKSPTISVLVNLAHALETTPSHILMLIEATIG